MGRRFVPPLSSAESAQVRNRDVNDPAPGARVRPRGAPRGRSRLGSACPLQGQMRGRLRIRSRTVARPERARDAVVACRVVDAVGPVTIAGATTVAGNGRLGARNGAAVRVTSALRTRVQRPDERGVNPSEVQRLDRVCRSLSLRTLPSCMRTAVVGGKVVRYKLSAALARAHRQNRGKTLTEGEAVALVETKRRARAGRRGTRSSVNDKSLFGLGRKRRVQLDARSS